MKILVVDDNQDYGLKICEALTGEGFETFYREDGKEALKFITSHKVDFILSDLNMPFTGFQLISELNDIEDETPFVLYTSGSGSEGVVDMAKTLMANNFIQYASFKKIRDYLTTCIHKAVEDNTEITRKYLGTEY